MSSDYFVLCLSHDPAIRIDIASRQRDEAIAAASDPAGHEDLDNHQHCDLVVGRYSWPLVEVGCPPSPKQAERRHQGCYHPHNPTWLDAKWLRLLLAVTVDEHRDPETSKAIERFHFGCWPPDRLARLRNELGVLIPHQIG
jgi:hypothetical protein